jgi:hypothetical protein
VLFKFNHFALRFMGFVHGTLFHNLSTLYFPLLLWRRHCHAATIAIDGRGATKSADFADDTYPGRSVESKGISIKKDARKRNVKKERLRITDLASCYLIAHFGHTLKRNAFNYRVAQRL